MVRPFSEDGGVKRIRGRRHTERRGRWLSAHPLCCQCKAKHVTRAADVVDHRVALTNGGADNESNFQSLCHACHDVKTAVDLGYTVKRVTGLDGWDVEESAPKTFRVAVNE